MNIYNNEFRGVLDTLVSTSEIIIDRPKGTAHTDSSPQFQNPSVSFLLPFYSVGTSYSYSDFFKEKYISKRSKDKTLLRLFVL